jgi:putative redox protein
VFHSPLDAIVSIDEAAKIYQAARHPKSFISLDKADHLLSKVEDSEYVATTIASWVSRYLELEQQDQACDRPDLVDGEVLITELNQRFLRGMYSNSHFLRADEPQKSSDFCAVCTAIAIFCVPTNPRNTAARTWVPRHTTCC